MDGAHLKEPDRSGEKFSKKWPLRIVSGVLLLAGALVFVSVTSFSGATYRHDVASKPLTIGQVPTTEVPTTMAPVVTTTTQPTTNIAQATTSTVPAARPSPGPPISQTDGASQIITVTTSSDSSTSGTFQAFQLVGGRWQPETNLTYASVGHNGLSVSRHEGDGTTPVGILVCLTNSMEMAHH